MKIMVNGVVQDATPEQEAEILAFQHGTNLNPDLYKYKLQEAIDTKATEKEYGSGVLCASYAQSTNEQWAAEAQAFIQWRDNCFEYGYDYLAKVESGEITNPTPEAFLNGLPELVWPVAQ